MRQSRSLSRPKAPNEDMPNPIDLFLRSLGRYTAALARLLLALGDSLLLTGDTIELVSAQFGQASLDSFNTLETFLHAVEQGLVAMVVIGPPPASNKNELSRRKSVNISGSSTGDVIGEDLRKKEKGKEGKQFKHRKTPIKLNISPSPKLSSVPPPPLSKFSIPPVFISSSLPLNSIQQTSGSQEVNKEVGEPPPLFSSSFPSSVSTSSNYTGNQSNEKKFNQNAGHTSFFRLINFFFSFLLSLYHYSPPLLFPSLCLLSFLTVILLAPSCKRPKGFPLVLFLVIFLLWSLLTFLNHYSMQKQLQHVRTETLVSYISSLAASSSASSSFESCMWLNTLLASLWTVEGSGGLGAYVSDSISVELNDQLQKVPPGVAKLRIKQFSLGSQGPIVSGIRMYRYHAPVCLSSGSGDGRSSSSSASYSGRGGSRSSAPLTSTGCERLIADIDLSYLSKDMNIALSMRPTLEQSLLPEVTVTLSQFALRGVLRLDTELIPDYPFVGNATLAFLTLPSTEITLHSFGGVELSNLPGIDQWLNGSLSWLLTQYTLPQLCPLDLLHSICPSCGEKKAPSPLNAVEVLVESFQLLSHATTAFVKNASKEFNFVKDNAKRWADELLTTALTKLPEQNSRRPQGQESLGVAEKVNSTTDEEEIHAAQPLDGIF